MSSSSNARGTAQTERRATYDISTSAKPQVASGFGGAKTNRTTERGQQSLQAALGGVTHKRIQSGLQRSGRHVEEHMVEKVHVTTRETLTTRTRSPERRHAPSNVPLSERPKPSEGTRSINVDHGLKSSKVDPPIGILLTCSLIKPAKLDASDICF